MADDKTSHNDGGTTMPKGIRGSAKFRLDCEPAFDYARERANVHLDSDGLHAVFASSRQQFALDSPVPLRQEGVPVSLACALITRQALS